MSEPAIRLENKTFSYDRKRNILEGLDFTLDFGEFAVLSGISGVGKTTLLSVINGVIPNISGGRFEGRVLFSGEDVTKLSIGKRAHFVGSVLQNADDQIVHDTVEDEVAFGCENLKIPPEEIGKRVAEELEKTGLTPDRRTRKLSGGQKQRLITAAAFAMGQKTLVLDEPLANLDRDSSLKLLRVLKDMTANGCAVLLVEHRLDLVLPFADRVYTLKDGRMQTETEPEKLLTDSSEIIPYDNEPITGGKRLISLRDIWHSAGHVDIIKGLSLDIYEGERITVLGPNGCGKTTLLKLLARLAEPDSGGYEQELVRSRRWDAPPKWFRQVGYVYQNPSYQLFMPTLRQEIECTAVSNEYAARMIEMFGLTGLEDRHPQSLSEGQKRRADVAAVCASKPKVLFLDEPTVGQDHGNLKLMLDSLHILQKETHCAIVTVTHDIRCKEALSDRKIVMKQGRIMRVEKRQPQ